MTKKDIEGFLSNPFFVALKPNKEDSMKVESLLNNSFKCGKQVIDDPFGKLLCNNGYINVYINHLTVTYFLFYLPALHYSPPFLFFFE